ncbi:MAG: TRAP transporter large permease [Pseudorhodoplanes sp.]|nr:TRAP transporter large permease [Pseudorhodoplanes sp.]
MEILLVFFVLLMGFLLVGVPAGYALAITSVVAFVVRWGFESLSFGLIAQMMIYGINSFPILAIPLFLLTGSIMNAGGISERIFAFATAVVGHIRGALAHVNVLGSLIFSGMSGSAAADAAGLGQIEIREMVRAGYDRPFSAALSAASATIGPVIPPSIPLILYGIIANTSVTRLFIGGIVPGLLLAFSFMIFCAYIAKKRNYPKGARVAPSVIMISFKRAFLPLMTPVIIIGGIWTGLFTPTEAAAVAAAYAILLAFLYREMDVRALFTVLRETAVSSSAIMFFLATAMIYNTALTRTQVPQIVTDFLFSLSGDALVILLLLNIILFVAGMFMSTAEVILLLTPLIAPLLPKLGIDLVHFGLIMVLNLMIGQLTPPFGIVLYVIMRVGNIEFVPLVRALVPFYFPMAVVLLLVVLFPPIVTWLPNYVLSK